jgi:hypothetical protein
MRKITFRAPRDEDWETVLALANRSVGDVDVAPPQDEWLANRRAFAKGGEQHHFVAVIGATVVGYGALEHAPEAAPGSYRLFVVTAPAELDSVGVRIFERETTLLEELGATASWFVEYVDDRRLNEFIRARGYTEARRISHEGVPLVVLARDHRSA